MPVEGWGLAVLILVAFAGGVLQGIVGFGSGLLLLPLLAVIAPSTLPGALVMLSFFLASAMAWLERSALNGRNVIRGVVGRTVGTLIGGTILVATPIEVLGMVFGAAILLTVISTALSGLAPFIHGRILAAGRITGIMGTVAGIGGPVLAMAYKPDSAQEMRSTLAFIFLVGNVLSLAMLQYVGRLPSGTWVVALMLVIPLGVGLALARHLNSRIDDSQVRKLVLYVSGLAGIVVIVDAASSL